MWQHKAMVGATTNKDCFHTKYQTCDNGLLLEGGTSGHFSKELVLDVIKRWL